jgi:hypothetical protein
MNTATRSRSSRPSRSSGSTRSHKPSKTPAKDQSTKARPANCAIHFRDNGEIKAVIDGLGKEDAAEFAKVFGYLSRDPRSVKVVSIAEGNTESDNAGESPLPATLVKHRIADLLAGLVGGKMHIYHSDSTFLKGDEAAKGHLYMGFDDAEDTEAGITLDDRRPEPLDVQLAAELRRVEKWYRKLAKKVEKHVSLRELFPREPSKAVSESPRKAK